MPPEALFVILDRNPPYAWVWVHDHATETH